jgi:hypothetical protein
VRIKRAILILTAVVLATAAPLRAWCEADCLAPAHAESTATSSHCKTTEPNNDSTSMSASFIADCPSVESARPVAIAKPIVAPAIAPQHPSTPAPRHPGTIGLP